MLIWVILLNWALKCGMETKSENLQIIAKDVPNNIRLHVYEGSHVIHMLELNILFIDLMHIEQYHIPRVTSK